MFQKLVSGGLIVTSITIAQFIVLFAVQIVFARLLEPAQFGVFAFITIITMFFNSFVSIYGDKYLIKEKNDTHKILDTIFTVELIWAFFILLFCIFILPILLTLLDKSHLIEYIQIFCIVLLYNPLIKPKALFEKELSFVKANMPMLISHIIGGIVGIILAYNDYGIWSLVWWKISVVFIETILIWSILPYKPRLHIDFEIFKKSLSFGYPLLIGAIIVFISSNIDYYIIDSLMDEKALGFYWMAYQISHYLFFIRVGINKVLFPVFAKLDNLKSQIKVFNMMTTVTSIIYFIPVFMILLFAEEIIMFVYGEKWLPSAILLKIFVVIVLIKAVASSVGPLLHSYGHTKADMELSFLNLILLPPFIYFFTLYYGTVGTAFAIFVVGNISVIYAYQVYVKKLIYNGYSLHFSKIFILITFVCLTVMFNNIYTIPFIYKIFIYIVLLITLYIIYLKDIEIILNKIRN
ncbi:MAG: hypothetical protein DRG78_02720 [Epsilonproteobacteria bacterium]|nr:MAG: hypothetical protein DRG78_02720 [Campylobacterota bacterium]